MNILDKIVLDKRKEVDLKKSLIPINGLEHITMFQREKKSLANTLISSSSGIIAEFKRRSPSKSDINLKADIAEIAIEYQHAGACGMSVLTDEIYFGGLLDDLITAGQSCELPLLRKEFIIDEYQIIESKAFGANVILLIAAILNPKQIKEFSQLAHSLDLEVLLEVHNEDELNHALMPSIDMVGVNNRNLKTFDVSLDTSKELSTLIPDDFVKVSESGISTIEAIKELQSYGYQGFLIGEHFMKTDKPGKSASQFIKNLGGLNL